MEAFSKALTALENPLRFAVRGGPQKVDRIKDLEATVKRAAERAMESTADTDLQEVLKTVISGLPSPLAAPDKRHAQLEITLGLVAEIRARLDGKSGQPTSPQPKSVSASRPASTVSSTKNRVVVPDGEAPSLEDSLQYLKGVGPRLAEHLATRNLRTVEDLLRFLPRRYEDRRGKGRIRDVKPGELATVEGEVILKSSRRVGRRSMLEVIIGDDSGNLVLTWFRVPGRSFGDRFQKGRRVRASGQVKIYKARLQMTHPETSLLGEASVAEEVSDSIVASYLEVDGIRPAQLRSIIERALPAARGLNEPLPAALRRKNALPDLAESVVALHSPPTDVKVEALHAMDTPWHHRFIYEELLMLQLAVLRRKAQTQLESGHSAQLDQSLSKTAAGLFSFELTGAQSRVLAEIESDLRGSMPMQRLLQGDVGSGKTAVALSAAAAVAQAGGQVAIMAPTELLAEQHARVALKSLTSAGIRIGLLTGSLSASERRKALAQIRDGHIQVVVGTHALIQDDVHYRRLALCIVDEQHRFGVMQRATLLEKGREGLGCAPDTLVMTATPIPRTLALTVYGDSDLSIIDELPPGRTPVLTKRYKESQREQAYKRVRSDVESGRQAYVVFPLVEESDKEGMDRLRDATGAAEELANGVLQGVRVGLLHGRMGADDKDRVMRSFVAGETQVLVATTVIEVGIDVPNATVMVIENAERFGLSQLHQLRGRVGRGAHQSHCMLVAQYTRSEDAWQRLRVMEETHDGFKIAEEDLNIRGPGDFMGTRQSGLPMLSMASLVRDQKWLIQARDDAAELLRVDPELHAPENQGIRRRVDELWRGVLELAQIG